MRPALAWQAFERIYLKQLQEEQDLSRSACMTSWVCPIYVPTPYFGLALDGTLGLSQIIFIDIWKVWMIDALAGVH